MIIFEMDDEEPKLLFSALEPYHMHLVAEIVRTDRRGFKRRSKNRFRHLRPSLSG